LSSASERWSRVAGQIWPRVAAVAGVLLVWWAAASSGVFDSTALPPPGDALRAFGDNFAQPTPPRESILAATQASLIRLVVGLGIGIVIGTLIGLAMIWFGLTERAILFVVIIASVPAVAIAAASAIRLVPPLLVRAGRTLGARRGTLYRRVVLPAAVPSYVAGLQSAWALGWRALMAGELISTGGKGLGHLLDANRQIFSTENIVAVMLMIIIVGMAVEAVFGIVDRRVRSRRGLLAST
jgi:NitT/TauT family transport system permease protein